MNLGDRVKQRRIDLKLSQQTLAKDIATQSQISKIEKNELQPGSQLLFNISRKLDCSMDFLYVGDELYTQLEQKLKVIERLLEERDYDALLPIIEGTYLSNGSYDEIATLKWVKSIITYHKYDDIDGAITYIDDAYAMLRSNMYVKLQISICNTKAIFYYKKNNYEYAKTILQEGLQIAKRFDVEENYKIKLLFTLSNIYSKENDYTRCLAYAQSALDIALESHRFMLFSETVYNIVYSKYRMGINDDSDEKQLEMALYLSDLSKKYKLSIMIRELLKELK